MATERIIPQEPYRTDAAPAIRIAARPSFRPSISGLLLLIGGLAALGVALAHIGGATQVQAIAWAFVVAAVLAGLRRWA